MGSYKTVVVGTDGSPSSFRAVDRAGRLASGPDGKVIVASAYLPPPEDRKAADVLKDEAYLVSGGHSVYEVLRTAGQRARDAGATRVEERAIVGAPVDVLVELAAEVGADLLVVGNLGMNTVADRLLGSVPSTISRRTSVDVLIVHTSG